MLCHLCGASESVTACHLDIVRTACTRNPEVLRITQSRLLLFLLTPAQNCPLPLPGGPSPAPLHPKRSPTSTGEAELKEERLPGRKASCSAAGSGSRGLPPSSPMVSSAHNPNKAEIPERRKDSTSTPVSWGVLGGWQPGRHPPVAQPVSVSWVTFLALRHLPPLQVPRPPHRVLLPPFGHSLDTRVLSVPSA